MDEGRDSTDAARQVFQAHDVAKHETVKQAALAGALSSRHAVAIAKGMSQLPPELTAEQKSLAEQAFISRAVANNPERLATLGPEILLEVAPEMVASADDRDAKLVWQRRRAVEKRSFSWGDDGDGSTWFRGTLPHLEAAPLIRLVEAHVESDRRAARDRLKATRATRPNPQIIRDQISHDIGRTPDQRRADGLIQLITEHRSGPTSIGDRPRIGITIREQDLRDRAENAGILATGTELPPVICGGCAATRT